MGIRIEFNPDLALRKFNSQNRLKEGCLPKIIEKGKVYSFLKEGQRNYWLEGEIPLFQTEGNYKFSRPIASITILESTHFPRNSKIWTKGRYYVEAVFNVKDKRIHFESMKRIR